MLKRIEKIEEKYNRITGMLIEKNITIATMESCTSGFIASLLTDKEGASAVVRGGYVTYTNQEKIRLGVLPEVIEKYGVYSEETAAQMAVCCQEAFRVNIGIGVTGSFGNVDPANRDSLPGQVYFSIAFDDDVYMYKREIGAETDRFSYKLAMADLIGDALMELIGG